MIPKDAVDQIRELHKSGMSERQIEVYTGHSRHHVRKVVGGLEGKVKTSNKLSVRERQDLMRIWFEMDSMKNRWGLWSYIETAITAQDVRR